MKYHFVFVLIAFLSPSLKAQLAPGELLAKLDQLDNRGKVLYIAAHPDDENTRLLSYLANERHYRTAYLSLTRGDGGQNLIGNEQAEELGLIRTQELLAARRTDGAEQFFTRAFDFGFSKNPEETFRIWDKEAVLSDVVLVIRKFRPDVIIARFPTTGEGGHGHHTASAILAQEAFAAAADPNRFPESVKLYGTWQTTALYWNNFRKWRDPKADVSNALALDIGAWLPLLGESVGEISAKSRSQHKSQGFGVALQRGEIIEYFDHLAGEKASKEPFEKLTAGWNQNSISDSISSIRNRFRPEKPAASIPSLVRLYEQFKKLPKQEQSDYHVHVLEELMLNCAGFYAEFTSTEPIAFPGKKSAVNFTYINRSSAPVSLISTRFILPHSEWKAHNQSLKSNLLFQFKDSLILPSELAVSNPYWLAEQHPIGLFKVDNLMDIGQPELEAPIQIEALIQIGAIQLTKRFPLHYTWVDPVKGELKRRVEVLPLTTVQLKQEILVLNQTDHRLLEFTIETNTDSLNTEVFLDLPETFISIPSSVSVVLGKSKKKQIIQFEIAASPTRELKAEGSFDVRVMMGNKKKNEVLHTISRIDYDHIPIQTWTKPAQVKMVYVNLQRKGEHIVYIPGADDKVGDCLANAGYEVKMIKAEDITADQLKWADAVLVGIRAFNTDEHMATAMPVLLQYVSNGGTLIEQYNTKNWISDVSVQPGPYPFEISRDRVTDEKAEMKLLVANHPVFTYPNAIQKSDFDGWIQERGLYFPEKWDAHYTPLIECNDPGEKALQGAVIVTDYGKGKFIYTGLSFFRELPAGVPGAYRLMANFIGWGN
jgi:LmbE family N-acetylglucosaminyl deacetylase